MSESTASLSLFAATWEQTLVSRKRTYPQWGRGLTEEQYASRDAQLDPLEHAAEGKLTTWVLAPRSDPATLDFKCACETYRRKGLIKRPGASSAENVIGYGIASVFTPPANRGKGYARHMMRLLHWVLAPRDKLPREFPANWGEPPIGLAGCGNASFSALYSDIGDQFYRNAGPDENSDGWIVRDPVGTCWPVSKDALPASESARNGLVIGWMNEDACKAIWTEDVNLIRKDLESSSSSHVLFTFLPDAGVGAFLVRRTEFFIPGQNYVMPTKWGVCITSDKQYDEKQTIPTFATWTLDVRPPPSTLIVTRIRATPHTFPALVSCLLEAARDSQMERVEVWNLPKELNEVAHALGGKSETREEHLNAFAWYGPEKSEDVEWRFNEKFCWC